jgi:hypothetical protein
VAVSEQLSERLNNSANGQEGRAFLGLEQEIRTAYSEYCRQHEVSTL